MDEVKSGDSNSPKPFPYPEDPYGGGESAPVQTAVVRATGGNGGSGAPPPPADEGEGDDEESGMLRMSFLEHLEELRSRLIKAVAGFGIAFLICIALSPELWKIVSAPAFAALQEIGIKDGHLTIISPMEGFNIIWFKLPMVMSLFVGSPWVLYQVWAFIAPGLYKRERRYAVPFVVTTAGLFITGGLFAYFIAFRYALAFLLGIGLSGGVVPMITVTYYFDTFVNVVLGVALVFELPVVIFFLTLLRLLSPRFLMRHSRYAILGIVVLAAVVTPTPDAFNMMIFALPMVGLYFVGIFASYMLVWKREGKKLPWARIWMWTALAIAILAGAGVAAALYYHVHFIPHWPYLIR